MIKILEFFVSKIKGSAFILDNNINIYDLYSIVSNRFLMLSRGFYKKIRIKKCGSFFFVGKRVVLKHKNNMFFGRSVTLENYVEINALSSEKLIIGDNVKIGSNSILSCTGNLKEIGKGIKIGSNCGIGDFSYLGAAGGIEIGNNVIMGQNVRFHSQNHLFLDITIPIKEQGVTSFGIKIGEDCWIGSGVVFLDGVTVGNGCVIGANTLVNKDIPEYSVAVGNPVKIVKNRKEMI